MNLADRRALAGRTRHRPPRSNLADVETKVARLQSVLREVVDAGTLGAAVTLASDALEDIT